MDRRVDDLQRDGDRLAARALEIFGEEGDGLYADQMGMAQRLSEELRTVPGLEVEVIPNDETYHEHARSKTEGIIHFTNALILQLKGMGEDVNMAEQMMTQAKNWGSADLSSLRFCTSGGAPLPVPLIEQYTKEKGIRFKQGFGMTEYGPGLFALPAEDAIRKAGSIGRPNYFVDVRVVDDENNPLGPNESGELVLKGPSGSSGYWNNPEATAEAIDDEGWFHTGDVVEYDDEWYFYVRDRKKDMFISGGENEYPVEIENILYKHPAVHICAVIGIPHEKWGEVGKACVVLKPDATATEEELIAYMQDQLARYKVPKSVEIMDALPLSGMGKILKRDLREQFVKEA